MTYPSRLLQSLDQQIQQCTDRVERSRLISRRSIHLARLNQLNEARAEIARLRAELGTSLDPASGAWILLAEGVTSYFEMDIERSFDRLRRSLGIGSSANISKVIPLSNAWLSHIYFHKGEYENSVHHLLATINSSAIEDHPSRCRAAIVASIICGYANRPIEARKWSHKARFHATAEGDEASLAALLYNITIYRVSESRIASAFNLPLPDDYEKLILELDSSMAFDDLASGAGLPDGPRILRAHTFVIEKSFERAITILKPSLSAGIFPYHRATVEADLAFAYASVGELQSAKDLLNSMEVSILDAFDPDDLAVSYARASRTYAALGDLASSQENSVRAERFLKEFRELQTKLQLLSSSIPDPDSFA